MHSNEKDFEDTRKQGQFVLSYIDGGEAEQWKEYYLNNVVKIDDAHPSWPTFTEIIASLRENFAKEDEVENSLRKLETMKQGDRTAEEVVNEFRILKSRAKLDDNALTIRLFRRILNPSLAMKILTDPAKAAKLENEKAVDGTVTRYRWYHKAIQYDQIYRDA